MEKCTENNSIVLCGTVADAPEYSHSSRAQEFYTFPLEVLRLSGNADRLNIIVSSELLREVEPDEADKLRITGQVRSFNNRKGEGAKLVITVFAKSIEPCFGEDENSVFLRGTLCKAPNLRSTPMGRDICDLMLAVNRHYGRSDYLPCICWGSKAREAAEWTVGTRLELNGRLQSRIYTKLSDEGSVRKTAFEISTSETEVIQESCLIM